MPEPVVWVAISVWLHDDELLVDAVQPDEFGSVELYWSSL